MMLRDTPYSKVLSLDIKEISWDARDVVSLEAKDHSLQ